MTIDPSPLTTTLEHITEQLSNVGQTCDAWGNESICDKSPTWQLEVRHTSPATQGCLPVTCLLCDECRDKAYKTLGVMGTGPYECANCKEDHLIVPFSFIIQEVRL